MHESLRHRRLLILVLVGLALLAFFVISDPITSGDETYSIVAYLLQRHPGVVSFDLGIAIVSVLVFAFPTSVFFLMFDLYGLRSPPYRHLGIFAHCLISIAINVIASFAILIVYGGWGPTLGGPIMTAILLFSLTLGAIDEWRIFSATERDC